MMAEQSRVGYSSASDKDIEQVVRFLREHGCYGGSSSSI